MGKIVFISGSRTVNKFTEDMVFELKKIMKNGDHVIVGDSEGTDKMVQVYYKLFKYDNVEVYCVNNRPRVNMNKFEIHSVHSSSHGREYFESKDIAMTNDCDYALAIWDGRSVGTKKNIDRIRAQGKEVKIVGYA